MIEQLTDGEQIVALILRASFREEGVHFLTPANLSQQLAYMRHPAGKVIQAHYHNQVPREVHHSQEVLVIRKGRIRVDFYDSCCRFMESRILEGGDTIMLITGGHGFEVLEEIEMIEVKQGPYIGEHDKTRFALPDLAKTSGTRSE